jgi:hypothetical protein
MHAAAVGPLTTLLWSPTGSGKPDADAEQGLGGYACGVGPAVTGRAATTVDYTGTGLIWPWMRYNKAA